ncbi:MAG: hypothetical protein ACM3PS_10560 [Syntrophothermus sp.]
MKEVFLSRAKEAYLFDCQVAGQGAEVLSVYQDVLYSFIRFTGDIKVRQLTPDHIRLYIANLSDGPMEGEEHENLVVSQYAVIQTWIHWMYVQKFINERDGGLVKPPALTSLFPSRITWSLTHYWKYPLSV